MLVIRPALVSDFGTMARAFHDSVRQAARQDYTEDQLRAWSPEILSPEHWQRRTANLEVRVALMGEALAGFIGFTLAGYIDLLFTRPEFVRQGVAKTLLREAEDALTKLGVTTAWTEASLTARRFFEAMGYRFVREQTVCCGGVELRNCRMEKTLTQGGAASARSITLKRSETLAPQVGRILESVSARLRGLVPDAEFHHIGATAIPGSLTKGDLDVLLLVSPARFQATVDLLRQHFVVKQPMNWTSEFASFGDDLGYELPLGIQVVVKDSSADFLLFLRDYFVANPDALAEYNRLKSAHAQEGPEDYWKAKDAFLAKILAARPR